MANKLYQVTESVSGDMGRFVCDNAIEALKKFLEDVEVNENADTWNFDFENHKWWYNKKTGKLRTMEAD